MIRIVSWNIQCGRGVDDVIDFSRIAQKIIEFGDFDVICLQEVSRFDPELDDGKGVDQMAALASHFPDFEPVFGPALNRRREGDQQRRQFGNMVLSKRPVLQVFNHILPQPVPPVACKNMTRQALEIVVAADNGPVRITTTHLEYHSEHQRLAQAERLHDIQAEAAHIHDTNNDDAAPSAGPYARIARPGKSLLCGDFNSLPHDPVYKTLTSANEGFSGYLDAWGLAHPNQPHAATCGLFDSRQWPEGPHCRDFFFLTEDLKSAVCDFQVNMETAASDHQPVLLALDC